VLIKRGDIMSLTLKEKIEAVRELMSEMTSSQDLGESCAETMDIDEEDLHEIADFVNGLLKQAK
jgi:hypothetical protein